MRDIKFRVWEPLNKKIHYMDFALYQKVLSDGIQPKYGIATSMKDADFTCYRFMNLDSLTIMQYTGLRDVNNKEIYESDIVHLSSNDGIDYNAAITFKDGGFCAIDGVEDDYTVRRYGLSRFDLDIEIIGNIYENPELLDN